MRSIKSTAMGIALVGMLGAAFSTSTYAFSTSVDFQPLSMTDTALDGQVASASEIDTSLTKFTAQYKDIAGLFSADDFRTPGAKKFLEKVKYDRPETITKINAFKKKLDNLQKKMRNVLSLQAVEAGPTQFARVYKLAQKAAKALELGSNFHIFIVQSPVFNAYTYSYKQDDFDVVLHSAAVVALSDDAMLALLGHEMGHVKDQAMLSQLILAADFEARNKDTASATHTPFYDKLFEELPASLRNHLATYAVDLVSQNANFEAFANDAQASDFSRNCELTADRAAVIVSGDAQAPLKLLSALAYGAGALSSEFNLNDLIKQIRTVLANTDSPEDVDFLVGQQESHPFSVLRLVEAADYGASKSFDTLKTRLNQNSFGKELDIFIRIVIQTADKAAKFKKYLEEKAETDDTLVRLKTKDQFNSQLQLLGTGFSQMGMLILGQLGASGLAAPGNALFDQFIAKIKSDKEDVIKALLTPPMVDLLKKKIEIATGDEQVELKTKLKQVQDLQELQ